MSRTSLRRIFCPACGQRLPQRWRRIPLWLRALTLPQVLRSRCSDCWPWFARGGHDDGLTDDERVGVPPFRPDPHLIGNVEGNSRIRDRDRASAQKYVDELDQERRPR